MIHNNDAHKLNGRSHAAAVDQIAGVRVNQSVPYGADRDAAALNRPSGEPTTTVDSHMSPYRLSLVDVESRNPRPDVTRTDIKNGVRELLSETDPEAVHYAWVTSDLIPVHIAEVPYAARGGVSRQRSGRSRIFRPPAGR